MGFELIQSLHKMIKKAPIVFQPYFKTVIWGGHRIMRYKGLPASDEKIGESWEISEVPGHESVVSQGNYAGLTISELISRFGVELLGAGVLNRYDGKFPLLIKFIDSHADVSVQVHPDDRLARERHGSMGKTELWYIIESEPGAKIYSGLSKELTPESFIRCVADKTFRNALAVHDSMPGDVFFLPAGRVHAIGAGNLLAEIQQTSDITYRIYDYDRLDSDGRPRELHTELAKDAIDFTVHENYKNTHTAREDRLHELASCDHFKTLKAEVDGKSEFGFDDSSFTIVICVAGEGTLNCADGAVELRKGMTALLPAAASRFNFVGRATLLIARS